MMTSEFPCLPPSLCQQNSNKIYSVNVLPEKYRGIFSSRFKCFNRIQSCLFDLVFNSHKSLAICSPTASGKTVLLELAIVRELLKLDRFNNGEHNRFHALYLAPLKSIVEEKCLEWQNRFERYGLQCFSLTGDTGLDDYNLYRNSNYSHVNILLATPEKFDYMIRTYPDSRQLLRLLQLVMIDEIHILDDRLRGDVLEATITRIKAIRDNANNIVKILNDHQQQALEDDHLRFMAISATAPNVCDIAAWLDIKNGLGVRLPPDYRPVPLKKYVFSFEPIPSAVTSEYRFDIQLSYKLERYIREYSSCKPTLVFCSTRRSVEFTAKVLASSQLSYFESHEQRAKFYYELSQLTSINMSDAKSTSFKNPELKTVLSSGVGFYHSGLDHFDRRLLEQLFTMSLIPILVSTSSLAMGVNLPAHLVVIKNTVQYNAGATCEYDISQILQMIGRAGRPQFDTEAKAIIMTRNDKKANYESLLNSEKNVESNLFRTLPEQLIIEIVLKTVTDINLAIDWLCSTFLFIRIVKNPSFYGSHVVKGDFNGAQPILMNWCQTTMKHLMTLGLIFIKSEGTTIEPTHLARIVTRHGISIGTTEKLIRFVRSKISLEELLNEMCSCRELCQDIVLRTNEKRFLNDLNKKIRFKFKDRFKTNVAKINCLIQATFECLNIETCLYQDCNRAIRSGQRVSKCLLEIFYYLYKMIDHNNLVGHPTKLEMYFQTLVSATRLAQAFRTKMWFDSDFVVKQLPKIGPTYSSVLVENGFTSFDKLINSDPREIEFRLKRNPPFGSYLIEEIKSLPKYRMLLRKLDHIENSIRLNPHLENSISTKVPIEFKLFLNYLSSNLENSITILKPEQHYFQLIIGCAECDRIISLHRISDKTLTMSGDYGYCVFTQHILLLLTNFIGKKKTTKQKDNTEDNNADDKKKSKKRKLKVVTIDDDNINKMELNEEFLKFEKQLEESSKSFTKQANETEVDLLVYHCSMQNQTSHTIQAMLISESFVGLDVETKLNIQFNSDGQLDPVNNKSEKSVKMIVTNHDQPYEDSIPFDNDDDELAFLLDDYNRSCLSEQQRNNEDSSSLDINSSTVFTVDNGSTDLLLSEDLIFKNRPDSGPSTATDPKQIKPIENNKNKSLIKKAVIKKLDIEPEIEHSTVTRLREKVSTHRKRIRQKRQDEDGLEEKRMSYVESIMNIIKEAEKSTTICKQNQPVFDPCFKYQFTPSKRTRKEFVKTLTPSTRNDCNFKPIQFSKYFTD